MPGTFGHAIPTGQGTGWELTSGGVLIRRRASGASVRHHQMLKTWGGTTLAQAGFTVAPTENGSKTEVSNSDGNWINYSASPGGLHGGILDGSGGSFYCRTTPLVFGCRFRTDTAVDSARWYIGLNYVGPTGGSDANATANSKVGLRYYPDVDSGNWQAWSDAGDSSNYNLTSIAAVATSTVYNLLFAWQGTTATFWLNGTRVDLTTASGFPSGVRLDVACGLYNYHVSAGRSIQFSHLWVTTGNLVD